MSQHLNMKHENFCVAEVLKECLPFTEEVFPFNHDGAGSSTYSTSAEPNTARQRSTHFNEGHLRSSCIHDGPTAARRWRISAYFAIGGFLKPCSTANCSGSFSTGVFNATFAECRKDVKWPGRPISFRCCSDVYISSTSL
jgi:hypothetical protein